MLHGQTEEYFVSEIQQKVQEMAPSQPTLCGYNSMGRDLMVTQDTFLRLGHPS